MEPSVMTVADYVAIVQRRKWSLILPAVLVFAAAAGVALLLPPVYKSTATILIEEQEIPSEYVKATVTSYAEQRLQSINQRVGAGVGTAALRELADTSVRSAEQLSRATRFPVLAAIPVIDTPGDVARRRVKTLALVAGVVVLIAGGLVFFHYQVMDLDVFWAKLMRRMAI